VDQFFLAATKGDLPTPSFGRHNAAGDGEDGLTVALEQDRALFSPNLL
jgi:hypothetical protein